MTDRPLFPAWVAKDQANRARESAQRLRRRFGPNAGADELEALAQQLDPEGVPLPDLPPIQWPTSPDGTVTIKLEQVPPKENDQ